MGSIAVDMNTITHLRITVATHMVATVNEQNTFSDISGKTGKTTAVHASSNNDKIVGGLRRLGHEIRALVARLYQRQVAGGCRRSGGSN